MTWLNARRDYTFLLISISFVVLALILSALYTTWSVANSQRHWCSILTTVEASLQKHPPAGKSGQSLLYDFKKLSSDFECGG